MTYSIYLLHVPTMTLITRITKHWWVGGSFDVKFILMTLFMLPVVLVVGLLYYVLVEQPCMNPLWFRGILRWIRRSRSTLRSHAPAQQLPAGEIPELAST